MVDGTTDVSFDKTFTRFEHECSGGDDVECSRRMLQLEDGDSDSICEHSPVGLVMVVVTVVVVFSVRSLAELLSHSVLSHSTCISCASCGTCA